MDKRHVLIIDDSPDDIELIERSLGKVADFCYQIDSATQPDELWQCLKKSHYDCLLIDYHLPSTSGLEILKSVRKEFACLPVVVLTGQANELQAANLIKAGAQDYINKARISGERLHEVISEAIARVQTAPSRNLLPGTQCNVLIIDDNPDDIEFCVRSLKRKSKRYRYQSASSGEEGLSLIDSFLPDCVILDHSLPGTTGVDFLPQILSVYPHLPIIIMTGQGNELIAVEAMKRGAENYLIKSELDADTLDKNITAAVRKKQLEHELSKKERVLTKKQQELNDAYAFQDLVFDSLPDYVFVKDHEFRIVRANQPFLDLYPDKSKVIGYTTVEDYPQDEADAFLAKDREAFDVGLSETLETITFPNGEVRILSTQKKRFENASGEVFILGVANDVTERETTLRALQKSNYDLEQFAYVASHDLKSPLNGIKKLVSWIEEDHHDELSKEALQHFTMIKSRVDRMSRLLTDLLEYARVNTKLSDNESVNFHEICHYLHGLNEFSDDFVLKVPEVEVQLPRVALQLVMMNLIGNAIKHHDKSTGQIEIDILPCPGGYNLTVTDDGPGIAPEYADKVFEMFQTLQPRDEVEGSGMGLAMVKKVVEYYSGRVALDTNYVAGCKVALFWPSKDNTFNLCKQAGVTV
ncbi:response regulator [Pseudoalteromonas rubra]|uniref:response regulator n=1 Tax=Pseudoalteromonas rubra TaxID=43658 RepID=UPI002DB57863|nr:response regulator [Pseudoalteromonas rubra]MEC4089586.1 response regulator [Pseudoalteromonas rubra]